MAVNALKSIIDFSGQVSCVCDVGRVALFWLKMASLCGKIHKEDLHPFELLGQQSQHPISILITFGC